MGNCNRLFVVTSVRISLMYNSLSIFFFFFLTPRINFVYRFLIFFLFFPKKHKKKEYDLLIIFYFWFHSIQIPISALIKLHSDLSRICNGKNYWITSSRLCYTLVTYLLLSTHLCCSSSNMEVVLIRV